MEVLPEAPGMGCSIFGDLSSPRARLTNSDSAADNYMLWRTRACRFLWLHTTHSLFVYLTRSCA